MVLDSIKVVVYFCLELKEVLSNGDTYSYICLGSDVVMDGAIAIVKDKVSLTIDETYEGVTHQLGDKLSLCSFDIIYITNATTAKVEVCYITIVGHNYYGVIFVSENTAYRQCVIVYQNVTYTGPQIRFLDVHVHALDDSLTAGGEIAECRQIEIGG